MRYTFPAAVMSLALASLPAGDLAAQSSSGSIWDVEVDFGLDFRGDYPRSLVEGTGDVPTALNLRSDGPVPAAGLAVSRRIPNVRAYYGLRLEGTYAHWTSIRDFGPAINPTERADTRIYKGAALATYRFFPFDLYGDCDCPTWGSGGWLKRAFYLEVGAGAGLQNFDDELQDRDETRVGGAYLARAGVAHRLNARFDVIAAIGFHGFLGSAQIINSHDYGIRPAFGLVYRPG